MTTTFTLAATGAVHVDRDELLRHRVNADALRGDAPGDLLSALSDEFVTRTGRSVPFLCQPLIAGRASFFAVFSSSNVSSTAGTTRPIASAAFANGATASTSLHRFRNAASSPCFFAASSVVSFLSFASSTAAARYFALLTNSDG